MQSIRDLEAEGRQTFEAEEKKISTFLTTGKPSGILHSLPTEVRESGCLTADKDKRDPAAQNQS